MIKVSNLFLFVFLISGLNLIESMHKLIETVENPINCTTTSYYSTNPFIEALNQALYFQYCDTFKQLIKNIKINVNEKTNTSLTTFGNTIREYLNGKIDIDLIEYLLQNGADINSYIEHTTYGKLTTLQYALYWYNHQKKHQQYWKDNSFNNDLYLNLIKALLDYGAIIDDESLIKIQRKNLKSSEPDNFYIRALQFFNHHLKLIEQAKTHPTKKLLQEAIGYNKLYIVQLIVENKPKLVSLDLIRLARTNSPVSLEILEKAFKLMKFVKTTKEDLPAEILDHIGRFVQKN